MISNLLGDCVIVRYSKIFTRSLNQALALLDMEKIHVGFLGDKIEDQ